MIKYYSLPADFKHTTIDEYKKLNDIYPDSQVSETYGNISVNSMFTSGRSLSIVPSVDIENFAKYVKYSQRNGISFNYTLNAPTIYNQEFTAEGREKIKALLKMLSNLGAYDITISLPSLIEVVKNLDSRFKIKVSTISSVTNINEALAYKKMGVDKIVLKESVNRKFNTIKSIVKAFGDKVEIIVNVICHKDCIYRQFHYLEDCVDKEVNKKIGYSYCTIRCVQRTYNNPENILKNSWIRPEDIKHYEEIGVKYYKIQGRHTVANGDPVKAVEYYFKQDYSGDLLRLLWLFSTKYHFPFSIQNKQLTDFLTPFLKNDNFCANDCEACNYCKKIADAYMKKEANLKLLLDYINSDDFDKFNSSFP